jgi:hypothetical protein
MDLQRVSARRRSLIWTLVLLSAVGLAVVGVLYGLLLQFVGDLACPTPGRDSDWGSLSWSILPPGPRCTWTEELNGIDRADGPGPVMTAWLVTLALAAVVERRANRWWKEAEREADGQATTRA